MLVKLALGNVRKSARDYVIYFVTISFSVALLYAFNTIDTHVDMLPHRRRMIQTVDSLMDVLSYVLMVALALLIIYANNYLIRRRAKEFALYQIFGMRRRSVATILTIETFVSSLSALIVGLALGVLLSQFLVFVTGRIVQETVTNYHFVFRPHVIMTTVIAFGIIFLLTLALNLLTLRRFQLVDLVKRSRMGEVSRLRSGWVALALCIGGIALIGYAYWRLIHIGYPFEKLYSTGDTDAVGQAWGNFGLTTALVCAGTYLLFYSLGGALLYFARASRTLYWRGLNMFTVREFASKIKSSALSMATISIVLFLMLSVIAPAFGVSTSIRQGVEKNALYDLAFSLGYDEFHGEYEGNGTRPVETEYAKSVTVEEVKALLEKQSSLHADTAGTYSGRFIGQDAHIAITPAVSIGYMTDENGDSVSGEHSVPSLADYIKASGYDISQWDYDIDKDFLTHDFSSFEVVPVSAYNSRRALAGLEALTIDEGEYAISSVFAFEGLSDMYASALNSGLEIEVAGQIVKPIGGGSVALDDSAAAIFVEDFLPTNRGIVVVSDSLFEKVKELENSYMQTYVVVNFDDDVQDTYTIDDVSQYVLAEYFESANSGDSEGSWYISSFSSRVNVLETAVEFLGLVIYVSIYVGFVLAMISAAMLAIQILSSFSEAAPRYRRLSQIGASRQQENRSIGVQIAWYFLIPLLVAVCHAWVAVAQALDFIELLLPMAIGRGALLTGVLVVSVYGVYALVSYWSAKSVVASEVNLAER